MSGNMLSCQLELAETPGGSHWIVGQPPITKSEYHRGGHQKNGRLSPLLANKFLAITDFNFFFSEAKNGIFFHFLIISTGVEIGVSVCIIFFQHVFLMIAYDRLRFKFFQR